jgi:hypothetical protein
VKCFSSASSGRRFFDFDSPTNGARCTDSSEKAAGPAAIPLIAVSIEERSVTAKRAGFRRLFSPPQESEVEFECELDFARISRPA